MSHPLRVAYKPNKSPHAGLCSNFLLEHGPVNPNFETQLGLPSCACLCTDAAARSPNGGGGRSFSATTRPTGRGSGKWASPPLLIPSYPPIHTPVSVEEWVGGAGMDTLIALCSQSSM